MCPIVASASRLCQFPIGLQLDARPLKGREFRHATDWLQKEDILDKETLVRYNMPKLAILDIAQEDMMITKRISSTQAQNNFGQVLDDVTQNRTRYIIERRGVPQVVILSFDDFTHVLDDESERQQMDAILRELRPEYRLGQVVAATSGTE
jgi:prevent-host-death family protein